MAEDGGIFTFGDAGFFGSAGALSLTAPIVGMAATRAGDGYWFATAAGRIYRFGDADYCGALPGRPNSPVVALA